ncbi:hypothetical protein [Deinococcus hohokamensis]|uniref:Uncharacterized protein n=1 Tax=Deinococcus hohokamensis TaxID=309883 RepID=A0ABV9I3Q5_9DEIO
MEAVFLVVLVGMGLLALLLYMSSPSAPTPKARRGPASRAPHALTGSAWEKRVMLQMRGDQARFQRTLAAKQAKYPKASRDELLEIIHYEYVRDHR